MGCASPTAGTNSLEIVTTGVYGEETISHHNPHHLQSLDKCVVQQQSAQQSKEQTATLSSGSNAAATRSAGKKTFHADYGLGNKLGKGAFAQVYLVKKGGAEQEQLAAKIMDLRVDRSVKPRSDQEAVDHKRRNAVETEIVILSRVVGLKHAITMTDSYIEGCFSYIVMEKCDRTLLAALEGMAMLNEYSVKRIFREMFEGLKAIHALGVVHRDVKPDNFLCVGPDVTVKLCDFGLASTIQPGQLLSGVYGTPPFMSPEMLCTQSYGELTDVWSVGVIAYVLLLGQFPYKPAEPSGKAMKAAIKAGIPEPTFKAKPRLETGGGAGITDAGRQFLMKLLVRNPSLRPNAAATLQLPWINDNGTSQQHSQSTSLRPMLYAARRAGAFDPPRNDKDVDKSGIDALMQELQTKQHKSSLGPQKLVGKATPSSASTEVSSMTASGCSRQSSLDFQAPGCVGVSGAQLH